MWFAMRSRLQKTCASAPIGQSHRQGPRLAFTAHAHVPVPTSPAKSSTPYARRGPPTYECRVVKKHDSTQLDISGATLTLKTPKGSDYAP